MAVLEYVCRMDGEGGGGGGGEGGGEMGAHIKTLGSTAMNIALKPPPTPGWDFLV